MISIDLYYLLITDEIVIESLMSFDYFKSNSGIVFRNILNCISLFTQIANTICNMQKKTLSKDEIHNIDQMLKQCESKIEYIKDAGFDTADYIYEERDPNIINEIIEEVTRRGKRVNNKNRITSLTKAINSACTKIREMGISEEADSTKRRYPSTQNTLRTFLKLAPEFIEILIMVIKLIERYKSKK